MPVPFQLSVQRFAVDFQRACRTVLFRSTDSSTRLIAAKAAERAGVGQL
jgi:hypothetical protein